MSASSSATLRVSSPRSAASGSAAQALEAEPDARERGAQLVRAVGEQQLVRLDQLLDALGGPVEAARKRRDLVAPLDGHARGEVALTELLDTALQTLEAARQPPRDRVGTEHEGENDRHGHDEQVRVRASGGYGGRTTRRRPSSSGRIQTCPAPRTSLQPPRSSLRVRQARSVRGRRRADAGLAVIQGEIQTADAVQLVDRSLLLRYGGRDRREQEPDAS